MRKNIVPFVWYPEDIRPDEHEPVVVRLDDDKLMTAFFVAGQWLGLEWIHGVLAVVDENKIKGWLFIPLTDSR